MIVLRSRPCNECHRRVVFARAGGRWLVFDADPVPEPLKHASSGFIISGTQANGVRLHAAKLCAELSISEDDAIATLRKEWPWHQRHMCRSGHAPEQREVTTTHGIAEVGAA